MDWSRVKAVFLAAVEEAAEDRSAFLDRACERARATLGWGEGTADEMCIAFVRTTVDSERLGHRPTYAGPLARHP